MTNTRRRAALRENTRAKRTIRFLGLVFTLPDEMSGSVLWDISDAENADDGGLAATMRILESMLGREQYMQARQAVADRRISIDRVERVIGDLVNACFRVYGIELGESSASSNSSMKNGN